MISSFHPSHILIRSPLLSVLALTAALVISAIAGPGSDAAFDNARMRISEDGDAPVILFFDQQPVPHAEFFDRYRAYFSLSDEHEFFLIRSHRDQLGQVHYRYGQRFRSVEVEHVQLILHTENDLVLSANGRLVHQLPTGAVPEISGSLALAAALEAVGADRYVWENPENEAYLKLDEDNPDATYYPAAELRLTHGPGAIVSSKMRLAYRFDVFAEAPFSREYIYVDALTGEILNRISRIYTEDTPGSGVSLYNGTVDMMVDSFEEGLYRLREANRGGGIDTYDIQNTSSYGNAIDFVSTSTHFGEDSTRAGVNVHFGTEGFYDYYLEVHDRDSYDGNGSLIRSYVHYSTSFNNAFWSADRAHYGDGDGNLFDPLVSVDVAAHECTHGVTQYTADLIYQAESGALNESFSDIFGAAVEFYVEGEAGDWLIGEDIMADGSAALRSMSDPNSEGHPDTYFGDFWSDLNGGDNGGVHSNSGVQNFWFYLLTEGGTGVNDNGDNYDVTGLGIETAEQIAYRNLAVYLTPSSGFFDARGGSIQAAEDLYGEGSAEYNTVIAAWDAVGVYYPTLVQAAVASQDSLEFLAEVEAGSDTATVDIFNGGLSPLTINDLSLADIQFEIVTEVSFPVVLEDFLDGLSLEIAFHPLTEGWSESELVVSSDDPVNPEVTVLVKGWGYEINPAVDGVIYATSGTQESGTLFTVDQNTGEATAIGPTGFDEVKGVTLRPSDGKLHGSVEAPGADETYLIHIDSETGEAHEVLTIQAGMIRAVVFDMDDNLYAARFNNGDLYLITPDNTQSLIGSTGISFLMGLTINPADGQLWGISLSDGVYTINTETAEATLIGSTGFPRTSALLFDAEGKLFGLSGFQADISDLIMINTFNGAGTLVGSTGFQGLTGLAINGTAVVGIGDPAYPQLPGEFRLRANFPNPFNPATVIAYDLPVSADVELRVYNMLGQELKTLISGRVDAGWQQVVWDGLDSGGHPAASGVYVYTLSAQGVNGTGYEASQKMLLVR